MVHVVNTHAVRQEAKSGPNNYDIPLSDDYDESFLQISETSEAQANSTSAPEIRQTATERLETELQPALDVGESNVAQPPSQTLVFQFSPPTCSWADAGR